jgi:hypothetical protein
LLGFLVEGWGDQLIRTRERQQAIDKCVGEIPNVSCGSCALDHADGNGKKVFDSVMEFPNEQNSRLFET